MIKNIFLTLMLLCFSISVLSQSSIANYTVTFTSNWSEVTHPHPTNNFPSNAHWSKLVGATHNENVVFLEMGQNASPGIEDVAELGSNTVFFSEITTAINAGFSNQLIDGEDLPSSLGTIVINDIITTEEFPLLTLVSMIAPSPDWLIAINSISLLDTNGDWENEITIDLFPYDAGTDSGTDYTSPNNNTNPQDPITSAQGVNPFSSEKMGSITITLEDVVLGINDFNTENIIKVFPNPCNDIITVSLSNSEIKTIHIYNILGEKINTIQSNNKSQIEINISDLKSGIYLLSIIDSTNRITLKKVVKL